MSEGFSFVAGTDPVQCQDLLRQLRAGAAAREVLQGWEHGGGGGGGGGT